MTPTKTIKKFMLNSLVAAISVTSFASLSQGSAIEFSTMKQDIVTLASDDMKGRANFSPEIDQAGSYIAKRFKEIGLSQLSGVQNFKQSFSIYQVAPTSLTISLNGEVVSEENIAIASAQTKVDWQLDAKNLATNNVSIVTIGQDDDMRAEIGKLNQAGGKHVVLIDPAHKGLFSRYKKYFQSGLIKNKLNDKHALALILTDVKSATSVSVNASAQVKEQKLTNIVGILPGKESPNEIVLYSAHYDHLGADGDGKIYNGADDDASGTTAVINLAQYYATQGNNKRTLMFAAFTAEEIGGFGSKHFSQQLNPDDVVAMVNIEMIGKPSKFGAGKVWMTGMERSNLGKLMNDALAKEQAAGKIHQDPYPEQRLFYRSDNATLARLGVPAHSFSSTQIDKDQHYHQTSDDIHSLDLKSMHTVINSLAVATKGLVDGSITPTRVDTSKVKAKGKIY